MDAQVYPLVACWTGRLAMHHMHECHNNGTCKQRLDFVDDPRVLYVHFLLFCPFFYQNLTLVGTGTLFCSSSIPPTRYTNVGFLFYFQWIQRLIHFSPSSDGFKGWGKVIARDGWKCLLSTLSDTHPLVDWILLDIILAASDVEGNFLVIRVNSLSL